MKPLILGTRGSDLARTQTRMVQTALNAARPDLDCEMRIISTVGDRRTDLKLSEFSRHDIVDKGIFTKELEIALAAGEIDVAVHSLKDVPTELDPAFTLSAVLERADTRDALISKEAFPNLNALPQGARIATSSVRRQAQLQWHRPDLHLEEIRGNVPTRLDKLQQDDGMVGTLLAMAGLHRLQYLGEGELTRLPWKEGTLHVLPLTPPDFLPACGQGAIALETRTDDADTAQALAAIHHAPTFARITAERLILERLQAGCHTPVGVDTELEDGQLAIHLRVFDEDQLSAPPREAKATGAASALTELVDQLMHSLQSS